MNIKAKIQGYSYSRYCELYQEFIGKRNCSKCRRLHGAAFRTRAAVASKQLTMLLSSTLHEVIELLKIYETLQQPDAVYEDEVLDAHNAYHFAQLSTSLQHIFRIRDGMGDQLDWPHLGLEHYRPIHYNHKINKVFCLKDYDAWITNNSNGT